MGNLLSFLRGDHSFEIRVKTGDLKNAGTDAIIQIRLHDSEGNSSDVIVLDNLFRNDFERGETDVFKVSKDKVKALGNKAQISRIELWRDDRGLFANWMVDIINIENLHTKEKFIFPVFRWIEEHIHYQIKLYDTSLPQSEEYPEQRKKELEDKRKMYEYEEKTKGLPIQVKKVPEDEMFSFSYKWDLLTQKMQLMAKTTIMKLMSSGEYDSIEDMTKHFDDVFPEPPDFNGWKNDAFFGSQRIAAHNYSLIELVKQIPDKLPVTDDMVGDLLEGLTLKDAIEQKRLFITDYVIMDGIPKKESMEICSPIGLYFVNKDDDLVPIAIQLYQKPGPENPVFTPKDSTLLWCLVKMWFNNADAAHHQGITHLGHTHLMMEGVAISSRRNLSPSHPIHKVLSPHFLYIIAINDRALTKLIPEGNWIDNNMNAGTHGTVELTRRGTAEWRFDCQGTLPEDLKKRGLDDPKVLPNYHYREDAVEVYDAILKYATAYVNHYYSSNDLLTGDEEIQNWFNELVAKRPDGVGFEGLSVDDKLTSPDQLSQIVACVIFVCSVSHAAANFPQYDQYCFPPNYPAFMRGAPPTSKDTTVTESDILKALPDRPTTLDIMIVTKILSTMPTQCLGDFEVNYIYDPAVLPFLEQFRSNLKDISARIKARNEKRKTRYHYLDPENIPNSISI